jgi:predicted GH43/DUF377 family glycosyl hydrolase
MPRWMLLTILTFPLLTSLATGCGEDHAARPAPVAAPVFTRQPAAEAVVQSGRAGWPIFPTDPCVVKDDEGYHLFYTSYFCNAGGEYYYSWDVGNLAACDILDAVATIGYAYSADEGLTWEFRGAPVLMPGSQEWQCGDLETPSVIQAGDRLYLFYSATGTFQGQPFPQRYQVGAATLDLTGGTIRQRLLDDGLTFTALPDPLLPYDTETTGFFNNTQEPSAVVRDDGTLEVFFVGLSLARPDLPPEVPGQDIVSIGMARAVFDPDLAPVELPSGYILPGANITEVKRYDGAYHVFATTGTAGEFHRSERIVYYRSTDGANFSDPTDLLLPETPFDSWGLMAPTVVVEPDRLVMFYSGWSCEDHPCFPEPLPPNTRFGYPSAGESACIYGAIGRAVATRP